jgi:glycosyltransferase involved in cell wall biosynthesis
MSPRIKMRTPLGLSKSDDPTRVDRAPLRICIVTQDFLRLSEGSDSAASITALAQHCAATGDTVTVLFVPNNTARKDEEWLAWQTQTREYFLELFLVNIEVLTESRLLPGLVPRQRASLAVYHFLKENKFDVVYFSLSGGLGHYTMLAKDTGCFLPRPLLYTVVESPMVWRAQADRFFLRDMEEIAVAHMERESVAASDGVICASQAMVQWMREEGWTLPKETLVLPFLLPMSPFGQAQTNLDDRRSRKINELVFLGHGDFHYGLTLFCDAIDLLAKRWNEPTKVTIIGTFGRIFGEHTGALVLRRSRQWSFPLSFLPRQDWEQSLAYLNKGNCLVVFPFLAADAPLAIYACAEKRIALIATQVGGIPEMFAAGRSAANLCEPTAAALADGMEAILRHGADLTPTLLTAAAKRARWSAHLAELAVRTDRDSAVAPSQPPTRGKRPLVSVVMAHHDRPNLLSQAIRSVENQTYPNTELILVDDGSKLPESRALLDSLQPEFTRRGWQIIRQKNLYLGAARNAGIRAAKGEFILFLDDDNVLFSHAIASLVNAMEASGADICTCLAKYLHELHTPTDQEFGVIQYLPLGGSLDLAFIFDTFGDANAIFRREVFDRIGYLVEDFGFVASDWEFFARAALSGLNVKIVPEPLYWYRSTGAGIFSNANWYDMRQIIFNLYKRFKFAHLEHLYHLVLAQNVSIYNQESSHFNLAGNPADEKYQKLRSLPADSEEALQLLAQFAAIEGRPETAIGLLAQSRQQIELKDRLVDGLTARAQSESAFGDGADVLVAEIALRREALRDAIVQTRRPPKGRTFAYVEGDERLFLEASSGATTVASLVRVCSTGATGASAQVRLDQEMPESTETLLLLLAPDRDPLYVVERIETNPALALASSGWQRLSTAHSPKTIRANLPVPANGPLNLIMAVRTASKASKRKTTACFSSIAVSLSTNANPAVRPRAGAPPQQRRACALSKEQMQTARLLGEHDAPYALLAYLPEEEGIFLRPSVDGPVAAILEYVIPPFCRKVVASVEVADELASPFEFAMALSKPGIGINWTKAKPDNALAFSGWLKIKRKFELHKLTVQMREICRLHLDLSLAIRLPSNSNPLPSQTFWRKFVLVWDD